MSPPQALIPWCVDKRRSSLPGRYLSSHRDMWYPLTVHSWHNHQLTTMRSEIFPDVGADTAELFSVLLPSILTPSQSVTTWTGESNWNEIKQARSPSPRVAPATYPIILIELILDHYYFYCHWTLLFFLLRVLVFFANSSNYFWYIEDCPAPTSVAGPTAQWASFVRGGAFWARGELLKPLSSMHHIATCLYTVVNSTQTRWWSNATKAGPIG